MRLAVTVGRGAPLLLLLFDRALQEIDEGANLPRHVSSGGIDNPGEARARIVSVVPETAEFALRLVRDDRLPFKVLRDPDLGYALTLGLPVWSGDDMICVFRRHGLDLPRFQGNDDWMQLVPATFVVDQDGRICGSFTGPDIRRRMSLEAIDAALRRARALVGPVGPSPAYH